MASSHDEFGRKSKESSKCRACTDFQTWTADLKKATTTQNEKTKTESTLNSHNDLNNSASNCPLDRELLGRTSWSFLHTVAAYYPEKPTEIQEKEMASFLNLFTKFYPCEDCSEDFKHRLAETPPTTGSRVALSQWLCGVHNQVNKKLGKKEFDCKLVDQRWRDGWEDGSCN